MQLSFVMPFTLREPLTGASCWRSEVNEDCVARFTLFLRSFLHMFRQDDLCEFIVVCPAGQCAAVRDIMSTATCDPRYIVVAESDVAPGVDAVLKADAEGRGGWYAQQIVKLAAHRIVKTPHYVVLDSDLVCIRPCGHASFIAGGRPLLNVESVEDYARLYTGGFASKEIGIKSERRVQSLRILGRDTGNANHATFYGETPVILSAPHVASMLRDLERSHGKDWTAVLTEQCGWTEYGLYFGYLDALGLTDTVYRPAGSDAILSLEKSVWQETSNYRSVRAYDYAHFFCDDRGYFVAIQSWIPKTSWLPPRYGSRLEFYRDMEQWIMGQTSKNLNIN
jgi:hypothetical protein